MVMHRKEHILINWIPAEIAPKDGTPFLAAFDNWPGVVMAMWNKQDGQWVAATPQADGDECIDSYFENEWFDEKDLKVWAEVKRG